MNNPDDISESLEKILKFFEADPADPGLKKFGSGIRDRKISNPG
jgi:hypothetical protein